METLKAVGLARFQNVDAVAGLGLARSALVCSHEEHLGTRSSGDLWRAKRLKAPLRIQNWW